MTTLREAAQHALEALKSCSGVPHWPALQPTIGALRAALTQQDEPVEPVAWRTFDGEGGYDYRTYADNENYAAEWAQRNPRHVGWVKPLYTAPPRCPNCASLEAQNTELDRRLAEMERAYENGYKAGVAHEREACAKVCERYELARSAAAAIRARGNT